MVSWDSKTLVLTKTEGPTALYSMPAAGGDEPRIVDCVHGRSLAVTEPNNLYYLGCPSAGAPWSIHKRDLTTGRDEVVGALDKAHTGFLGLAVSPDGKTILYAPFLARGSDLMMLENFR
jgi:Tol biopolymer transport system component